MPDTPPTRSPDDEQAFLAAYDAARFPRPSVAVDLALVTVEGGSLRALLIRRDEHPGRGRWALPGGFVGLDESLDEAAARVLQQKAGLSDVFTEQLYTFGDPQRDPRTRVISVAYYALVDAERLASAYAPNGNVRVAPLAVPWPALEGGRVDALDEQGRPLEPAFDHDLILGVTVQRLRGKLDYAPIGFELLPERFTLRQLQQVHESVLGRAVNKDSFRRRMIATGYIEATGEREREVLHRPAELFRFSLTPRG